MNTTRHVGYAPLADEIHIGRARDGRFTGKHYNVTPSAIEAVIHYVCDNIARGGTREVFFGNRGFKITVKPIPNPKGEMK